MVAVAVSFVAWHDLARGGPVSAAELAAVVEGFPDPDSVRLTDLVVPVHVDLPCGRPLPLSECLPRAVRVCRCVCACVYVIFFVRLCVSCVCDYV